MKRLSVSTIEKDFSEYLAVLSDGILSGGAGGGPSLPGFGAASSAGAYPQKILVAFSGGVDSLALLALSVRTLGAARVVPVYVNHNLRSVNELSAEISLNRKNCALLGVTLVEKSVPRGSIRDAARRGGGVEAAARDFRYSGLADVACETGCGFIATAHHRDDQLETVLMRIVRGGTVPALRGIAYSICLKPSASSGFPDPTAGRIFSRGQEETHTLSSTCRRIPAGTGSCGPEELRSADEQTHRPSHGYIWVVRPLLDFRKAELESYVRSLGLSWSTDSTNSDNSIQRNYLRNVIIPGLSRVMPDWEDSLERIRRYAVTRSGGNRAAFRSFMHLGRGLSASGGLGCTDISDPAQGLAGYADGSMFSSGSSKYSGRANPARSAAGCGSGRLSASGGSVCSDEANPVRSMAEYGDGSLSASGGSGCSYEANPVRSVAEYGGGSLSAFGDSRCADGANPVRSAAVDSDGSLCAPMAFDCGDITNPTRSAAKYGSGGLPAAGSSGCFDSFAVSSFSVDVSQSIPVDVLRSMSSEEALLTLFSLWDAEMQRRVQMPQTLFRRVLSSLDKPYAEESSNGGSFLIYRNRVYIVSHYKQNEYAEFERDVYSRDSGFTAACYAMNGLSWKIPSLSGSLVFTKNGKKTNLLIDNFLIKSILKLRYVKPGDRIVLKDGSKLVLRLLQDQKVPQVLRSRVPVLVDGDEVVAVFGSVFGGRDRICGRFLKPGLRGASCFERSEDSGALCASLAQSEYYVYFIN